MTLPRLLLLTDRAQLHLGRSLVRTIAECVEAGATHVVVRELDETPAAREGLAAAIAATGATVIAAHTPLAAASGLHLPSGAPWLGGPMVGRSCHSAAEVRVAAAEGAAYATLSPFALTVSKPGYGPALDPAEYAAAAVAGIPVYALGGITASNAADAIAAGAHGVAVMGEVMRAADPAAVVRQLLEATS